MNIIEGLGISLMLFSATNLFTNSGATLFCWSIGMIILIIGTKKVTQ